MEIKVTTLKQLLEDVPQEVIEEALKRAADATLKEMMDRTWERQRFWYWMPDPTFQQLRPSIKFEKPEGSE
jgi:hypothetical protein